MTSEKLDPYIFLQMKNFLFFAFLSTKKIFPSRSCSSSGKNSNPFKIGLGFQITKSILLKIILIDPNKFIEELLNLGWTKFKIIRFP